jgi:hypothetical protein
MSYSMHRKGCFKCGNCLSSCFLARISIFPVERSKIQWVTLRKIAHLRSVYAITVVSPAMSRQLVRLQRLKLGSSVTAVAA